MNLTYLTDCQVLYKEAVDTIFKILRKTIDVIENMSGEYIKMVENSCLLCMST